MSRFLPSSFNKCYCCLSLRAGVFLDSLCSLAVPYLCEFIALAYVMPEHHKNAETPDRYFHIRIPYLNSRVDIFSVIHASTYVIGMIGSYKKSPKLIKYHKYLLYFNVVSTPLVLIECMWKSSSKWHEITMMPDDPDMPENFERDMKNMLFMLVAFNCVYFGVTYMQKIYAAYVATKYEKYLLLSEEENKEK
ncbi:hypothetical protein PS15m_008059 [Mucor circinelloides]